MIRSRAAPQRAQVRRCAGLTAKGAQNGKRILPASQSTHKHLAERVETIPDEGRVRSAISSTASPIQQTQQRHAPASTGYVWYAVLLLSVVNIFNYMDRMALSVLLPFIKVDLRLSDAELGLLVGLAFSLFYAVFGIPIARWADRGVRSNIIALALATWSVMTALAGAAQNFWQLFATRLGVGIGEAGCLPPSQSIICDYVPFKRRPGVFAIHGFGAIAGLMLGMALAGWLGGLVGWRWAFVILGLPGLLLALIVKATLREPTRGFYDAPAARPESAADGLRFLWRCRTYRLLIVFMATNGFVQFGLNQWLPSFYARSFGLDPATVGISLGIAFGVGQGAGILLGGLISNRAMLIDVRLPLKIGCAAALLAMPLAVAALQVPSVVGSILLIVLMGLLWATPSGPVIAATYSVTTAAMRATAGAITIFFTSAVGIGLGPFCVGLLSDALAPSLGHESLRYALLVPVALHPVLAIAAYRAAMHLPNDLAAVGARLEAEGRATVVR